MATGNEIWHDDPSCYHPYDPRSMSDQKCDDADDRSTHEECKEYFLFHGCGFMTQIEKYNFYIQKNNRHSRGASVFLGFV